MGWLSKQISTLETNLSNYIADEGYQSPLEIVGICKRQAMKPIMYYNRDYQYAEPISDSVIRTNDTYVSTSGWRPATMKLKTDIQDAEFENIEKYFDIQS